MAKKKTYLEILEEEQAKDAQRKAEGKIHFKEDSRATRVQYSLPQYQGKSESKKTYTWEKELLDPLKYKGVRSYNDKFKAWANSKGMTDGQAAEFRKYMDFQEDSVWQEPETTTKEDDPETFKDESVKQNQSLNYARGAYIVNNNGQAENAINSLVGGNLSAYQQRTARDAEAKAAQEKAEATTKAAVKDYEKDDNRPAYAKFIDRYILPISKGATEAFIPGNNERMIQNDLADGKIDNPVNQASLIDRGKETKALEFGGTMLGLGAAYSRGYGTVNTIGKAAAIANPYLRRAVTGGLAGLGTESGLAATRELANSEALTAEDHALNIALGAAGGAVLDPALFGAGKALNLKGMTEGMTDELLETFTKNLTDNAPTPPKQVPYNVMANPVKPSALPVEEIAQAEDDLLNAWQQRQVYEDDFVSSQLAPFRESQEQAASADALWQGTKQAQTEAQRIKEYYGKIIPDGSSKDNINAIPPQFRGAKNGKGNDIYKFAEEEGFANADEAIKFLKNIDEATKTRKKDLTKDSDGLKIQESDWSALEEAARKSFADGEGQTFDTLIDDLMNVHKDLNTPKSNNMLDDFLRSPENPDDISKLIDPSVPKNVNIGGKPQAAPVSSQSTDTVLKNLENVNNSQAVDNTLDNLNPTQAEAKKGNDFLMRLNPQKFNDTTADNSMFSYSTSEPAQVADEMNILQKGYEGLVSSLHKFQVVSDKLIKKNKTTLQENLKKQIEDAEKANMPEKAKRLKNELKYLGKGESELLKSAQNEQAAYLLTDDLIKSTYGSAEAALEKAKINVADAWEYQAAKNLDWFMNKGGHGDYQLPKGWDKGRLVDVINKWNGNEAMKTFSDSLNEIRVTRLDYLEKYGLKNSEEHALLSQNPHYIPMVKDMDWTKPAIEAAIKRKGDVGRANPNVMALGKGDENFFNNPVESLVGATYTSIRNALRNKTNGEIARLALLDADGTFIQHTKKPATYDGNVVEHYDEGIVQNYAISQDLADVIKDLRSSDKAVGIAEKVTGIIGSLKTTSTSYQLKAIPRDWTQYIVNSDGNPFRNMYELMSVLASPKKSMQQAMKEGGAFHNAFKDSMGSYRTTQEMAQKFVEQNRLKGDKDTVVSSENAAKNAGKVLFKVLTADYQIGAKLGNFGDTAPRVAALRNVEREFAPAIKELEEALANATDDFTKSTLKSELNSLKTKFQQEKIFRSRDVINYQRSGNSTWAKLIKKYWNFSNTATQSVDRYIRQVRKKPVATLTKTLAAATPMIAAQELAYRNASEEDKKMYDDTPDFLRSTMYVFVIDGHRFMWPKSFEVALVTSPIEALLNSTHQYDEESAKKKVQDGVVQGIRELVPLELGDLMTLNFSGMSLTQPISEIQSNQKLLNGKPISYYDRYESDTPKSDFFLEEGTTVDDVSTDFTSPTSKAISNVIGTNPDYLAHLVNYGGDQGKNALAILDALVQRDVEERQKTATQNLNPFQDYFNSKNGSYLWRNAYTEKSKEGQK